VLTVKGRKRRLDTIRWNEEVDLAIVDLATRCIMTKVGELLGPFKRSESDLPLIPFNGI
jgi:hypothetical protein